MAWSMSTLCALALALTCGLQVNTAWVQQSNHVSSICSMWGNFHFKMFDGDLYQFQGTCEYNLVSDCHGPVQSFSVHVKRSGTPGISKVTRVLVTIGGIAIELTKNLVMVNNDIVNLPHYVAGVMLEENSIYIKLYAKLGLSVTWNKDDAVMLELDIKYANRTCGLCGDYNGNPVVNEFLSDGRVTGFIEFANKHRIHSPNDVCEDPYEEFENEDNAVDKCQSYREDCSELLLDESWSFCRNVLSPEPYIQACMMDTCASGPGDTDDSTFFCSTLSEYSRQCSHAGGKPPNWRTPTFCAMTCPFNMEYSESGSPCLDTCTNTDTSSLCAEHKMDGCFCPPGTVFDDISERGCIPQEQCQCKHNKVYNTGEVLLKDDEECVCQQGRWICESLVLPGVCAIEEGSHFTTFDGKEFTFHGRCNYVLSKDCVASKFIILGQLIPCVAHHTDTCLKSIVLILNNDKSNAIIIKDDGIIRHNGDIKLPYTTADFTVFRPSSFYIMLQTTFGLHLYVQLVPVMQLYITLDQSFQTYTCGLCGNFNMVLYDELMTPQGVVEGTATSFANSWKAQSNCPDQIERLDDPCSYSIDSESYAEHWCSKLKDKEDVFAKCHSTVNPESYYKRCKYSSCTCEKSEDCLCAVFSSYVRACRAKGVFLQSWRDTVCEKYTESCPATQTFNYIVQQCQRTCDSLSLERQGCSTDYVPVDGCACPAGLYESVNGVCVTMDKCPCYHNGEHFKPGKSINIKNDHCICTNGKLQCQSWRSRITGCPAPKVFFNCSTAGPDEHGIECAQTCAQKNVDCYPTGCESGCKCPEGLLDDGRGFCVKEHDCPCKHDNHFYAPGSEIMEECNKCICKHGEWDCTKNTCPGTCTIYGSGHYNTFDKQRFGFSGYCSYIAVQNNCGNQTRTFHVITENVPCGTTGTTCSKAVRIILGRTELELRDGKMTEIKAETGLSIKFNVRYVGLYLVIDSEIGLTVLWDFKTTVRIILQPYHMGEVCGLCGNFNGNGKDDFTTQDSLHVSDVLEFVNSWKLDSGCPSANPDFDPCIQAQNRHNWAKLQCSIIKSDTFKECHDKVEWTPYYDNCVKDSCACDTGGDCECFCTAVAAYAQACNEAKVCVAWRTPEICPVFCDYYNHLNECIWHYSPCETPCYKTCLNPNGICTNPLPHLEGCYPKCPEDKPIFDEKNQVCVEECPGCFINGTEYTPGEEIPTKIPCNFCYCHENGSEICFLRPVEGGGDDLETYENIKNSENEICKQPEDISCRNVENPDLSLEEFVQSTATTPVSTTSQHTVTTTKAITSQLSVTSTTRKPTTTAETSTTPKTVPTSTTGKTTKPTTTLLTTTESTTSQQTVTTTPSTISTTTAETSTTPETVPTSTTGKTTKPTTTPLTTTESTTSQQTVTTTPPTISTTTAETSITPKTVPTSTTGKTTKPTPTPVVSTTPTSIATTTECFCIINGVHYEPGKPIFEDKDIGSGVCLSMFCSDSCLILNTTRPCPTTATPPPPLKNCTEWGVQENETFEICNCTLARCIENNTVEIIPYECPPLQNITCSNGKQPVLVPDEYHCCEQYACDCFCEGWGDPHYITFDGRFYSHQGECTYVLMKEISHKHHLNIYIDNVNCDPRESVSCPRSIIVSYHNIEITLKNHNLIGAAKLEALLENSPLKLPFEEKGLRVLSSGLTLILQIPKLKVVVMFGVTGFSVNLPFEYFGNNTQGHCGTCNNNMADDCMLPGGELVDDCAVMANSWKDLNNPDCKPRPEEPETVAPTKAPCPINAVCELLKSDLFKECHPHVSPQNYFTGCQFDSCHMSNPTVVCTSVQTYAIACSQAGVCINWRDHTDICTAECPADKVYLPCGPVDPPTCKDKPDDNFMNVTTEGCFCPDGMKLFSKESGVCVDKCGCLDPSGQGREFGEKFQYGCKDCVCDESSVSIICKPRQCLNDSNQLTCSDPGFIVTNVTDPSDACCTILTCSCESSTCPSVNAKCSTGYTPVFKVPEGKCCPEYTCEPKSVCVHKGLEYEPGTSIPVINCQECRCTHDVDPNTQLYKVQCGMVTCNEKCEPGYSYVESDTYECCGKCVKTKCVLNYNGTVQILENGAEWTPSNEACDKFVCTMTDGEYVTTNYKIQCPPFNISNCQPGTVQLSSNRCCQVCVDMDSGCKVQTSFDYITHNNCRSKTTVEQTHCEGHCDSYSKYTELGSSSCSCCQASRTSKHTVSLDCKNGDTINHTYLHVEACSCDQTRCLGKSQSTPTNAEDTRRRRSFRLP
ncbi:mucin-2-like isoform X2 [Tachysurus ichikawai]